MARRKRYTFEELERTFDRTGGDCHLCGRWLSFEDYGVRTSPGGWLMEHSRAKARGGTDHPNNLYPSCYSCNERKGTRRALDVRRENGLDCIPSSRRARQRETVLLLAVIGLPVLLSALAGSQPPQHPLRLPHRPPYGYR
jgi:hypothetical protein